MGEIEFKEGAWDKARTDLQATLGLIEQLKGGFAERATWQVLLEIFQNLLHGVPWIAYPIPAGYLLFRGRIRNDVELFSNVKEMSFRPPGTVNDFGRCHRPGFSVFYGSNNLDTVLSELSPNRGDKVHVAVAQTKAADPAHVTAIGEIDYVRRYGRPLIGNDQTRRMIQNFLDTGLRAEADQRVLVLDAFFAELFYAVARREREYKVTSPLSDLLFGVSASVQERPYSIDGFAYPSVAHRGGINFALPAERFAAKMSITNCMAFEITDYLGFGIYGRHQYAQSAAIDKCGTIEWVRL